MRFHAVYRRLYFWLGSALVDLMDAPPLRISLQEDASPTPIPYDAYYFNII